MLNLIIYVHGVHKVKVLDTGCVHLFVTTQIEARQAPLSMEFSRQEYWTGLPFPSLGDLPDPGIKPKFPTLQADSLPSEPPGKHILPFKLPSVKFYNFLYIYACVSCSVVSDSATP